MLLDVLNCRVLIWQGLSPDIVLSLPSPLQPRNVLVGRKLWCSPTDDEPQDVQLISNTLVGELAEFGEGVILDVDRDCSIFSYGYFNCNFWHNHLKNGSTSFRSKSGTCVVAGW